MIRWFKTPKVGFTKTQDVSGKGADGVTSKGLCEALGIDPMNNICISKEYNRDSEKGAIQFARAVEALCTMRHMKGLENYVPTVYQVDYKKMKIRSAFLESRTVMKCLEDKNIFDPQYTDFYIEIFQKIEELQDVLISLKCIHGDFTVNNLLVQDTGSYSIKVIDFDDFRDFKDSDPDYFTVFLRSATDDLAKFVSSITTAIKKMESKRNPNIDSIQLKTSMYNRLGEMFLRTEKKTLSAVLSGLTRNLSLNRPAERAQFDFLTKKK